MNFGYNKYNQSTDAIRLSFKNMLTAFNQKQSSPVNAPTYNEPHVYKALHPSPQWTSCGEDQSAQFVLFGPSKNFDTGTQCCVKPKLSGNDLIPINSLLSSKELEPGITVSSSPMSNTEQDLLAEYPSTSSTIAKRKSSRTLEVPPVIKYNNANLKRAKPGPLMIKELSPRYELCPVKDMVFLISDMIQELIHTNDDLTLKSGVLTRFHSRTPPPISVLNYLQRIALHATLTPPLLLSMVYYIDKLCSMYPSFTVNSLTVHRFLITASTVAAKGLSDSFWSNTTYARIGGIKSTELGLLELDFLYRLDWRILPRPDALLKYYHGLVARTKSYRLSSEIIFVNHHKNTYTDDDNDDDDDDDDEEEEEGEDQDDHEGEKEESLLNERRKSEA